MSIDDTLLHQIQEAIQHPPKRDAESVAFRRKRMEEFRERLRQKIGIVDLAVPSIRELRSGDGSTH